MSTDEVVIVTAKSKEQKLQERDEKRKKVAKGYYNLPEDEIQAVIARAQKGSQKDQEFLFQIFNNFLEKYVNMLSTGYYDLRDYDIKQFVYLFIGDKTLRVKLRNDQFNFKAYKEVTNIIKGIVYMVKRYNDEDDVRQTVQLTFLQCVLHYKRRGEIPFSGYLYRYFFYSLKKNVDNLLIDQNGLNSYPLMTDDQVTSSNLGDSTNMSEPGNGMAIHETKSVDPAGPTVEDMLQIESIDEYWVMGERCSYPFTSLTIHERQLLKWRFVDGLRPNKIAEKTSDHPNTCRQHIKVIVDKVKKLVDEDAPYR